MIDRTPKRILMTADTVGGVWTYALELMAALAPAGVQFGLATMGASPTASQREELRALPNVELFEGRYKLEWMDDPWSDVVAAGEWLLEVEGKFQPDLIHLNGYAHGNLAWRAPALIVAHSCVLSWWKAVKGERAPEKYERYRQAVAAGLRAAEIVVAPTYAMLEALVEHYCVPKATQVIANGRDPRKFFPGEKQNFVLSAGRLWDEAKNVKAVCACSRKLPWPVRVAGETQHPSGNSIEFPAVTCLGKLSQAEMAAELGRASIFAHPAKYEPFGLAVLEAALSGCALVLGDIPSLRENWSGAAIFVDPNNSAELEHALNDLIAEPAFRASLASQAKERTANFSIERTAQAYLETYTALIRHAEPVLAL
jgi:glycogen synthase